MSVPSIPEDFWKWLIDGEDGTAGPAMAKSIEFQRGAQAAVDYMKDEIDKLKQLNQSLADLLRNLPKGLLQDIELAKFIHDEDSEKDVLYKLSLAKWNKRRIDATTHGMFDSDDKPFGEESEHEEPASHPENASESQVLSGVSCSHNVLLSVDDLLSILAGNEFGSGPVRISMLLKDANRAEQLCKMLNVPMGVVS